jgi:hypothetical protein
MEGFPEVQLDERSSQWVGRTEFERERVVKGQRSEVGKHPALEIS